MEKFELEGTWWQPGRESERHEHVSGKLLYNPRIGARLITTTPLQEPIHISGELGKAFIVSRSNSQLPAIHGRVNNEEITLYSCRLRDKWDPYSGDVWYANLLLKGQHVNAEKEPVFANLQVRFCNLNHWLSPATFSWGTNAQHWPSPIEIQLGRATLIFKIEKREIVLSHKLELFADGVVEIVPSSPLSVNDYLTDYVIPLTHFFSLNMGWLTRPDRITGRLDTEDNVSIGIYPHIDAGDIEQPDFQSKQRKFSFYELSDNIEGYMRNWLELYAKTREAQMLYFGLFNLPLVYPHLVIFVTYHTLEAFYSHRDVDKNKNKDEKKNKDKNKKKGWFECLVDEYMADYQDTLDLLAAQSGDIKQDLDKFKREVVDTRNFLAHYDRKGKEHILSENRDLWRLSRQMSLLVELCFFKGMGISPELISEVMDERYVESYINPY